jgi:hypothetical protein
MPPLKYVVDLFRVCTEVAVKFIPKLRRLGLDETGQVVKDVERSLSVVMSKENQ